MKSLLLVVVVCSAASPVESAQARVGHLPSPGCVCLLDGSEVETVVSGTVTDVSAGRATIHVDVVFGTPSVDAGAELVVDAAGFGRDGGPGAVALDTSHTGSGLLVYLVATPSGAPSPRDRLLIDDGGMVACQGATIDIATAAAAALADDCETALGDLGSGMEGDDMALNIGLAFGLGRGGPTVTEDPRGSFGGSGSTWAEGLAWRLSASVTSGTFAQFGVRATGMMSVGDDAPSAIEGLAVVRLGGIYFVEAGLGLGYASTAPNDTMGSAFFGQVGWFFTRVVAMVLSVDYTSEFFAAMLGVEWWARGSQSAP